MRKKVVKGSGYIYGALVNLMIASAFGVALLVAFGVGILALPGAYFFDSVAPLVMLVGGMSLSYLIYFIWISTELEKEAY